eukprot:3293265-Prymnesium_polylepis.1
MRLGSARWLERSPPARLGSRMAAPRQTPSSPIGAACYCWRDCCWRRSRQAPATRCSTRLLTTAGCANTRRWQGH